MSLCSVADFPRVVGFRKEAVHHSSMTEHVLSSALSFYLRIIILPIIFHFL